MLSCDAPRVEGGFLQRAIPIGKIDVGDPDLDAVVAGVADELGGLVKTHRLRIQDRHAKDVGIVGLEPA